MSIKVKHIILRSWREGDIYFGWENNYSALKQNAFLFDQIGVLGLSSLRQVTSSVTKNKKLKLVTPQLKAAILSSRLKEFIKLFLLKPPSSAARTPPGAYFL